MCLRELTAEELPEWDALVDVSPQGSVFCRSWWLQATCKTPRVLGCFEHGQLVAGMPIYFETRFGFSLCGMPKLTQTWGVVMEPLCGGVTSVTSREMRILRTFADHLSKFSFFYQQFHPSLQNWLPFYWKGFAETSRVTYVLDDVNDQAQIWRGLAPRICRNIKKADRLGIKVAQCTIGELWGLVAKTFARQRESMGFTKGYLERVCGSARAENQGECFGAKDTNGRLHAAAFLVWDTKRAYYLVSGADPNLRTSGAGCLLAWHAIQFSAERTRVFDFEGSMMEGVERFYRGFGAKQVSYNLLMKFPLWAYVYLRCARRMLAPSLRQ